MNERELIAQLDQALEDVLAGRPVPAGTGTDLLRVAEALKALPSDDFRNRLGKELARAANSMKEENMTAAQAVPKGYNSLMPYLIVNGASDFIDFLKTTFGAQERMRVPGPGGGIMHAEVTIEESVIELADAGDRYPARPGILHVYVPDVDATYRKALDAGGTSKYGIVDQDYGDREASVQDRFGNTWYIAKRRSPDAVRG